MSSRVGNPPARPTMIGKYRILRQLAQGGMAEIYLASASGIEGFEKLCVLKRVLPLLQNNDEVVQMFLDEARIAASLLHSNIAQVFDIGQDNGAHFFVMEFLRGEDLRHFLERSLHRRQPVPFAHVATIITGVCAALHHAHEMRGKDGKPLSIVHRDVSPQNIFITHDGTVKLCDFGIAKSTAQLTETRVGTVKGKLRYMSPEQSRAEPLDRRSDLFSLSIVLWELIALERLFSGKSDFDIFRQIGEAPIPRPSERRSDVPPGLEAIVMKGLSRNRDERFQTAQEMQVAIEEWVREERVHASPLTLGRYMLELFGPPSPTIESFLERVTEADPLAKHIARLNENEASDSDPSMATVISWSYLEDAPTHVAGEPHETTNEDTAPAFDGGTVTEDAPLVVGPAPNAAEPDTDTITRERTGSLSTAQVARIRIAVGGALLMTAGIGFWFARTQAHDAPSTVAAPVTHEAELADPPQLDVPTPPTPAPMAVAPPTPVVRNHAPSHHALAHANAVARESADPKPPVPPTPQASTKKGWDALYPP